MPEIDEVSVFGTDVNRLGEVVAGGIVLYSDRLNPGDVEEFWNQTVTLADYVRSRGMGFGNELFWDQDRSVDRDGLHDIINE